MSNAQKINEMIQSIIDSMPAGIKNLPKELELHLKSALQSTLNKMDMVTREEFDAQTGVLLRTRKKLEMLEKKVEQLEKSE